METDLLDTIRSLNSSGGQEPAPPAPPSNPEPTPAAPAAPVQQPVAPAAQAPAVPAQPTPTPAAPAPPADDKKLPDPPFLERLLNKQPVIPAAQEPAAAPAAPAAAAPTPPATPEPAGDFSRLSALTEGRIKTEEDFKSFVDNHNQLLEQVKEGVKPKFEDKRKQLAYDLITSATGDSIQVAKRQLEALSLDTKTLPAKELLFSEFMLDPSNADLSPSQMKELFDLDYDQRYVDIENNPLLKRQHEIAARRAKESIEKIQNEWQAAQPAEPGKIPDDVVASVASVAKEFTGLKFSFSDTPTDNELLNIPANPTEVARIQQAMINPAEDFSTFTGKFKKPDGSFDFKGYFQEKYERENHKEIRQKFLEHGKTLGRLEEIQKNRNASTPADLSDKGRSAAPIVPQKNFMDTMVDAVNANKR